MMHILPLHIGALILAAGCNCAADRLTGTSAPPQPRPVAQQQQEPPETITIDATACRRLIRHRPEPDVAYQPGVDVYGRTVASADLDDAPRIQIPEVITIPLTPELRQFLPNASSPYDRLEGSRLDLGMITLSGDMLTFNGQPLSSEAEDNLAVLCLGMAR